MERVVQVVYVAHAISAPMELGLRTWRRHRRSVEELAAEVARLGLSPIVPAELPGRTHREAMRADHELVRRSDAVLVHESEWTADSAGVAREVRWAREEGVPVCRFRSRS